MQPVTPVNIQKMATKTSVLYVNHRNNVVDNRLSNQLELYEKQYVYNITRLDHDRISLRQFLKDIYRCDSDSDPAIKYLNEPDTSLFLTYHQYGADNMALRPLQTQRAARPLPIIYSTERSKSGKPAKQPGRPKTSNSLPTISSSAEYASSEKARSTAKSQLPRINEQRAPLSHRPRLERSRTTPPEDIISHLERRKSSTTVATAEHSVTPSNKSVSSVLNKRGRSKSKIEMDLIQKILEERNQRHQLKSRNIMDKVSEFCKNIEEFTVKQKADVEPSRYSIAL